MSLPTEGIPIAVHPRACGERLFSLPARQGGTGSSPRLRGTQIAAGLGVANDRFIPAPAGNAIPTNSTFPPSSVHPRACGERLLPCVMLRVGAGSSPRLRGTPGRAPLQPAPCRFIPAPAGNARSGGYCSSGWPVHPRACGERSVATAIADGISGSSPRLRGTRCHRRRSRRSERFIPAPAGNAIVNPVSHPSEPVHPRACGERAASRAQSTHVAGSSPRLRGTRCGITTGSITGTVHPRACGERVDGNDPMEPEDGSSPRLRGTRHTPGCATHS